MGTNGIDSAVLCSRQIPTIPSAGTTQARVRGGVDPAVADVFDPGAKALVGDEIPASAREAYGVTQQVAVRVNGFGGVTKHLGQLAMPAEQTNTWGSVGVDTGQVEGHRCEGLSSTVGSGRDMGGLLAVRGEVADTPCIGPASQEL